jgi:hypothetical protein
LLHGAEVKNVTGEECGLHELEAWRDRMGWAAYYALQCLFRSEPQGGDAAAYISRLHGRVQVLASEGELDGPLLRTLEVLSGSTASKTLPRNPAKSSEKEEGYETFVKSLRL